MLLRHTVPGEQSLIAIKSGARVGRSPVSVAEMQSFFEEGGYRDSSLWLTFGYEHIADRPPRWMQSSNLYQSSFPVSDLNNPDSPALPIYWDEALAFTRWASRRSGLNLDLPSLDVLRDAYSEGVIENHFEEWTGILDDGFHVSDRGRYGTNEATSAPNRDWLNNTDFVIRTTRGRDRRTSATIEGSSIGFRIAIRPLIVTPRIRLVDVTPQVIHWLRQDPAAMSHLSASAFEHLVANRLEKLGMGVKLLGRPYKKDGGIDLIAWPERTKSLPFLLAAQVKHHSTGRKVGVATVRDTLGLASHAPFNAGLIVTNTDFSLDAKFLAERHSHLMRLRGFEDLVRWLRDEFEPDLEWRELPTKIEVAPGLVIDLTDNSGKQLT